MRRALNPTRACVLVMIVIATLGCGDPPPPPPDLEPPADLFSGPEDPPPPETVYAPLPPDQQRVTESTRSVAPAFVDDYGYNSETDTPVRRVMYRVTMAIPRSLGDYNPRIPSPTSELQLIVSNDRLRARFVGQGWPFADGTQVRLRRDQPGAYLFNDEGGRPLGPGQLAHWFEGGRPRFEPTHHVRTPFVWIRGQGRQPEPPRLGDPGDLVCRLVAEWVNASTDELLSRCVEGVTPKKFRVGVWWMTRTADLAATLPRRGLRADHVDSPVLPQRSTSGTFLSNALLARVRRERSLAPGFVQPVTPREGLLVRNRGASRMIVVVGGTAIGWVAPNEDAHFRALRPGVYQVGAMRPFGPSAAGLREVHVPGHVTLPR